MTDELLFDGESQTVEYKRARPESSKSYLKTVAAFANAHGGTLVFGIDDKTHEVIGIPDSQVFNDMDAISNTIMDSIEPEIVPNISTQTLEGKPHIVVEVPFGPRCPYYLKSKGWKAASMCVSVLRHAKPIWNGPAFSLSNTQNVDMTEPSAAGGRRAAKK